MIICKGHKGEVWHYLGILESRLPAYLAVGWSDSGIRETKPSVSEPIVLVLWEGEAPAKPEGAVW